MTGAADCLRRQLPIAPDHAAYPGHFPGFPLLPGAVLLDEALCEIGRARQVDLREWRLGSVKFLGLVRPGDPLWLEHSAHDGTIRFAITGAGRAVASGVLSRAA
jgi:3-hydroxymyristoyl/3-hydroxydecanoyl-(acyl carrier protein) dehydratase